jgi:hypothetical protein
MSVEMIFEVGFNHCCRNLVSNQPTEIDNLTIKLSCNLLNEVTGFTESCLVEFFGLWARVLSFLGPGMDLKIVGEFPKETEKTVWNDGVMITNTSGPERIEARYVISKVVVVETNESKPNRYIEFDRKAKLKECKTVPANVKNLDFPNYWIDSKRRYVDKNPLAFRPLTSITADVPVINVAVAFISNSPPGPYKFSHPSAPYVRTHVQVCDLSFQQLRLAAIRGSTEDVPTYHLHLQIDENVEPDALPWLCVGDVMQVNTVKPVFAQRQAWNLLHKQKNFGDTKIKIWSVDSDEVLDLIGNKISGVVEPAEIKRLRDWIRERLLKDSLLSDLHRGVLVKRNDWFSGRDLVARVEKINRYTNSIYVTDFSLNEQEEEFVEVRIRSSQQNFTDALNYLFTHIEKHQSKTLYVLMRNLRVNSADNTLYCSVEHVTRVPEICKDVQDLISTQQIANTQRTTQPETACTPGNVDNEGFAFNQMIPTQWRSALRLNNSQEMMASTQTGYVDSNSQVAFEFVDDDEEDQENALCKNSVSQPESGKAVSPNQIKRQRIDPSLN